VDPTDDAVIIDDIARHPYDVIASGFRDAWPALFITDESGQLSLDAFTRARRLAAEAGEAVPATLTRLGFVSEQDMAGAFAQALGLPLADAAAWPRDTMPIPELSPAFLRHMRVLPLTMPTSCEADTILPLAMADPTDDYAAEAVALFTGRRVLRFVALPTDLDAALDRLLPNSIGTEGDDSGDNDSFSSGSAGASWIDLIHMRLPDALTLPLLALGLLAEAASGSGQFAVHVLGAIVGYAAFKCIAIAYRTVRGRDGLGGGDAKLLAVAGAWVGWTALPDVVLLAALLGIAGAIVSRARGHAMSPMTALPFGPYLATALWIVRLHGPLIFGTGE
jgi:Flp pilus assembly protein protease CpaA